MAITKMKPARIALFALVAFLGLGATGGGAVLIISPSGRLMGMPLSMLSRSPFHSFLVPGLVLFFMLGLLPCLLLFPLLRHTRSAFADRFNLFGYMQWPWTFTIYTAFALIGWIQVQMSFLQAVHWAHTLYMFLAVAIIFVALLPSNINEYKTLRQ